MKKNIYVLLLIVLIGALCVSMCACKPTDNPVVGGDVSYVVVRFNDNFSGNYAKQEIEAGKTVTLPADPSRSGYIFKGWFTDYKCSAETTFDSTKPVTSNLTVYASWEKLDTSSVITLKFMDNKTADKEIVVEKGSAYAKPVDPVYDENQTYGFVGWFVDEDCKTSYDFSTLISGDLTLYACWVKQAFNLVFNYNYTNCPQPKNVVARVGVALEMPEEPTRPLFAFEGWWTAISGGVQFTADAAVDKDITLFARWSRSQFNVSFFANGATVAEGTTLTKVIDKTASAVSVAAEIQGKFTYVGHDFAGWYLVATDAESPLPADKIADLTSITSDVNVYAAWTLHEYSVSFDLNYESAPTAPSAQTVKYGKTATAPTAPERQDYLFSGWFSDEACQEAFTFDMTISSNLTLHAKWIENISTPETVTVSYFYDLGSGDVNYAEKTLTFNTAASTDAPAQPEVKDFYFAGWWTDKTYTKKFNMESNLTDDTIVYGKMLKKYTFEAEAVNLEGKTGQGTSTNSFEEALIYDASYVKGGDVSNGYFIRELYYNGAFLDFEIEADDEVFDAVLYLRVSSESYEFFTTKTIDGVKYNYLSETEFKIIVNGEWNGDTPLSWLSYGGLLMPMANLAEREDLAQNKTPFQNVLIVSNLHLEKGRNVITLYVDNNNHGGTFHAESPTIDCIYIYSSTPLSMFDFEYYTRENVKRG